jgi:hypothetical protein
MTVAGCQSCGKTVEADADGGFFGQPAGPCPSCGRLMLWMTAADGIELREDTRGSTGLTRAVERAQAARLSLARRATRTSGPPRRRTA